MNAQARNYLGASLIEAAYGGQAPVAIQPRTLKRKRSRITKAVLLRFVRAYVRRHRDKAITDQEWIEL